MTLSEHDWLVLERYVRRCADEMELRDWNFIVRRRPCDDDAYATIVPTYGRKVADIYFHENFRGYAPDVQRHTIVHELVHCHLEAAANMVYKDLEEYLGKTADQVFWNGFKRQIKYGVDALAYTIARHLPLIDWSLS